MNIHMPLTRAAQSPIKGTKRSMVAAVITLAGIMMATHATPSYAQDSKPVNKEELKDSEEKNGIKTDPPITEPTVERVKVDWQKSEMSNMKTLGETLSAGKELWLGNGDERFLAVYQEANTPTPSGAVIILHDDGRHARWPQTTATISDALPDYGWTTLTVSLPRADKAPQPPRPTPTLAIKQEEAAQEGSDQEAISEATKDTVKEQDSDLMAVDDSMGKNNPMSEAEMQNTRQALAEDITSGRLFAAYQYLTQQGMLNVVISGNGLGAPRAAKLIQDMPAPEPSSPDVRPANPVAALIIVNAENHIPTTDADLSQALSNPSLPVLDVFFGSDPKTLAEAKRRKQHAKRNGLEIYQQLKLPLLNNQLSLGENNLSKRIRGFINRHAKGKVTTLR